METLCVWPALLYRRLRYGYAFRRIPLTQGKYTIVDPDDFEKLSQYKWYAAKGVHTFYAQRAIHKDGKRKTILMHRQVMHAEKDILVDHINRNGLDDRKANLRFATYTQNAWNCERKVSTDSSKYKGLCWEKDNRRWRVRISINNKSKHLGFFDDEKEAAGVYDAAAKKYRGEYAFLNLSKSKRQNFYKTPI